MNVSKLVLRNSQKKMENAFLVSRTTASTVRLTDLKFALNAIIQLSYKMENAFLIVL